MYEVLIIQGEEPPETMSDLFSGNANVKPHVVVGGEEAMNMLQSDHNIQLILTDSHAQGKVDSLQLMLKARALSPAARVLIAKNDDFLHVTKKIGIARFVSRTKDKKAIEKAALDLLKLEGTDMNLENMELLDVVQFAHLSGRTAVLHIRHEDHKGKIGFLEGELVHAEFKKKRGEDALFGLLALNQGDIFLQDSAVISSVTIEHAWSDLATRMEDSILSLRTKALEQEKEEEAKAKAKAEEEITESDVSELLDMEGEQAVAISSEEGDLGGAFFSEEELMEIGDLSTPPSDSVIQDIEIAVDESVSLEEGLAMISGTHGAPASRDELARIAEDVPLESVMGEQQNITSANQLPPVAMTHDGPLQFTAENNLGDISIQLQDVLVQLCDEIPEFIATDIVHREDGLQVAGITAVEDYDHVAAAAYYSDVLNATHQALLGFGLDEAPDELLVTTDQAYILLRPVGMGPFMHMTIMHRTGNLGIARVVLRRYESVFHQILPEL